MCFYLCCLHSNLLIISTYSKYYYKRIDLEAVACGLKKIIVMGSQGEGVIFWEKTQNSQDRIHKFMIKKIHIHLRL